MPTISIAILGTAEKAFTEAAILDREDRLKRWEDRQQVELEVSDDETVGSILRRAGLAMEIRGPVGHDAPVPITFGIYNGETEFKHTSYRLTIVQESGLAQWNVPYESVSYGQLRRSVDLGVERGDPERLYYVTFPGLGNGVVITFALLIAALEVVYKVLQITGAIEDNIGLARRIRDALASRTKDGSAVLESEAERWRGRGADVPAVRHTVENAPWTADDLAALLGCGPDQAVAALRVFGASELEDGTWNIDADDEARLMRALMDEIGLSYDLGHEDFEKTLTWRCQVLLTTGERAPRPFVDAYKFGDEEISKAFRTTGQADNSDGFDDDFDDEDFDDEPERSLPLDALLLRCSCGKQECEAVAGFGLANGRLKIGFTGPTDHFVADPRFISDVARQVEEAIEQATGSSDD